MKILITGSNGFIGKNLKYFLIENQHKILEQNRNNNIKKLNLTYCLGFAGISFFEEIKGH